MVRTPLRLPLIADVVPEDHASSVSPTSRASLGDVSPSKWRHPPSFYCPVSQQCMHDPVVLCDGHTYERRHIQRWLLEHSTSPVSGLELPQKDLFPNHALRNAIEEYFQQVFCAHRRAIRKSIQTPHAKADGGESEDLRSNQPLLRTMDALMQCSLNMTADLSLEQILRQIMGEAKMLVGAEVASVFLVDAARQELYSTVNSTGGELRIPITAGIAGSVASSGEPVIIHDTYSDKRSFCKRVDKKTGFKTRSMICVPLKVNGVGVIGVVQLINKLNGGVLSERPADSSPFLAAEPASSSSAGESFTEEDLQFLQIFASQASTAVANSGCMAEMFDEEAAATGGVEGQGLVPRSTSKSSDSSFFDRPVRKSSDKKLGEKTSSMGDEASKMKKLDVLCIGDSDSTDSATNEDEPREFSLLNISAQAEGLLKEAYDSWHFDALELAELTGNRPLSTLAAYLFDRHWLVDHFDFDRTKLHRFLQHVECGYDDGHAYHNRAHAASVLHMMHAYMYLGGIGEAVNKALTDEEGVDDKSGQLVLLACLLAAAVHDYEHRGVTNDFLIKTHDKRAVVYNDQSVNENHHVAAAFALLRRPDLNFLEKLSEADYRQLRKLMVEIVLATDMACHGSVLQSFKALLDAPAASSSSTAAVASADSPTNTQPSPLSGEPSFCFVPATTQEALLLLKMVMKCSDLGHLTLDWKLHNQWVKRLETEFFAQGDEERKLGLSISFLMDRTKPGASATQTGFMDFVVMPLFSSLVRAAPSAAPVLTAVKENRDRWQVVEQARKRAEEDAAAEAKRAAAEAAASAVECGDANPCDADLDEDADEASTAPGDSSPRRSSKRSGRARQRAARFWAKVRVRTPSPEL